jgi:hypothetical protein
MDFGGANALVSGALDQLQRLRDDPNRVIQQLNRFSNAKWDLDTERSCRNQNEKERGLSAEGLWKVNTFLPVIDQIMISVRSRFRQNKEIFDSISQFAPKNFPSIVDAIDNSEELSVKISAFCDNYGLDSGECARELISFAATFQKFNKIRQANVYVEDASEDSEDNVDEEREAPADGERLREIRSNVSYHRALEILANTLYHLVDAYPILYQAYGKILAIPMTSCTPERTFSVVKRVKSRLRSTMEQEGLEALILIAIEPTIADGLDIEKIIDMLGATSPELSGLLIK